MGVYDKFSLKGKTAIVTGGEGLIGGVIKQTIVELGGTFLSLDLKPTAHMQRNICDRDALESSSRLTHVDIVVNAAVGNQAAITDPYNGWQYDIDVGLTGALNMCATFGERMNEGKGGVVLNIGSDLGLIGPDFSLYRDGFYKPASYSAVKHGMIGLTRYFAALWGGKVRCNCLCPGGVDQGQAVPIVPMGRLARLDELQGPLALLLSDASSYMTGAIVCVDGGRTAV